MTIDKFIALSAAVAACISAIAALIVIRQSNIQRKLSYKPQILLKPQFFEYKFSNTSHNIFNKINFRDDSENNSHKKNIAVNIGLGAALEIKVEWIYDSTKMINNINENLKKLCKPFYLVKDKFGISLERTDGSDGGSWHRDLKQDDIDYILSSSQNPSPSEILIPFHFISLICCNIIYAHSAGEILDKSSNKLEVIIYYKDIGGEKHTAHYIADVSLTMFSQGNDNTLATGSLIFKKKQEMSMAEDKIKKIREMRSKISEEKEINYFSEL
ncbi:hypothetical protein F3J27_08930 [Enterobacter sp. Ap-916]|uniref:hypothetical protein n=1 Tax=unclassified Enterobacter TaxID=2608935 RepID=UPI0014209F9D|nr:MULTISPECIES: hypothetical protein [unclassified Enterobacter]NIF58980.1 hypothetical protein [Enterobacter sp. Ap-867]NIG29604.1 hypothetical protein [Enterobacter sp. Ap-916]